ncbi:MAG: hypothetical protein JJV89_02355 [Desulfosarcina sp.]|nr:hypothetical protein [Desulfobacterales bacterium]
MITGTEQSTYKKKTFSLLGRILHQYGYIITPECSGYTFTENSSTLSRTADAFDFMAYNPEGRKIFFLYYDKDREKFFKNISAEIRAAEKDLFNVLYYMIFPSSEKMNKFRTLEWAENWQRGFFISLEELEKKVEQIDQVDSGFIPVKIHKKEHKTRSKGSIRHCVAEIISNSPVGDGKNPEHYILKFKATGLHRIVPGQFVMIDTLPVGKRRQADSNNYNNPRFRSGYRSGDLTNKGFKRKSFLKRPFGIHRCYYKYFKLNYLKHLSLPPDLAEISHTLFPHEFEILYKLIPGGTGTNELKEINKGERIKMLGPLGNPENPVSWRLNGIEEIHLVGGGVGMAPLVFFGQALKFYSYNIKAFLGIDKIETLMRTAPLARTFAAKTEHVFVYIDELSKIGLKSDEIFLSSEKRIDKKLIMNKISANNLHHGFITEQYKAYLGKLKSHKKIMIITCGPKPMLTALKKVVDEFHIPMKVLLEKRMGCGIGVCMSCVCRTIKNNREEYSRVCTNGPMFDSEEICWEKL